MSSLPRNNTAYRDELSGNLVFSSVVFPGHGEKSASSRVGAANGFIVSTAIPSLPRTHFQFSGAYRRRGKVMTSRQLALLETVIMLLYSTDQKLQPQTDIYEQFRYDREVLNVYCTMSAARQKMNKTIGYYVFIMSESGCVPEIVLTNSRFPGRSIATTHSRFCGPRDGVLTTRLNANVKYSRAFCLRVRELRQRPKAKEG